MSDLQARVAAIRAKKPKATAAQQKYLEQLFIDIGYSSTQRRGMLKADCGVAFLDELLRLEATELIEKLKDWKSNRRLAEQVFEEEQEF